MGEEFRNETPCSGTSHYEYTPEPPKKKRRKGVVILVLCLCVAALVLGAGGAYYMENRGDRLSEGDSTTQPKTEPEETTADADDNKEPTDQDERDESEPADSPDKPEEPSQAEKPDSADKLMTPSEVYAACVNSTVGITTSITTNYFGYPTTSAASGSGFILTEDGYIVTNHHVVEDADSVTVSFYDGSTASATIVATDESNDLAVLKVKQTGLTPVKLGDSGSMRVGDNVAAIGNPLGELTFSLTTGIVSALNREVTMSSGITMNLIQTDCAINSGNSGGALFNYYGEVVGITNAKYSSSSSGVSIDNIGFAIPITDVRTIIYCIVENGYAAKPFVGVTVQNVPQESLDEGLPKGAQVLEVSKDSPAEDAGIQADDIITHVNDVAVNGSTELGLQIKKADFGEKLKLTVYRNGKTLTITVTVGQMRLD